MSNKININEGQNNLLNLKIDISQTEEDKDYSQAISTLNNQNNPQYDYISKKYENEPSLEFTSKNKLDNLNNLQLSKMYRNIRNHENKKITEKFEDKIYNLNSQISLLNQDLKILKKENLSLEEELGFLQSEKEKLIKIKNDEIELLKEKINDLEEKYEKEKVKKNENEKKAKNFRNKAEEYDVIYDKLKKVTEENDYLLSVNNNLNDSLAKVQKENMIINEKYLEQKANLEGLKIDIDGLNQNILFYEDKTKEQENKINNLEIELKKAKLINKNNEQLMVDNDLNLNLSRLNHNSFMINNKINDEINNMKIIHEKEILNIKKEYDKIIKSKTDDFLIEINEYKNKISDYELRLKDKENAVNLYKNHLDDYNTKTNDEINLLKIELDNKKKELDSKNNMYQEQIAALTLHKNENDKLKEKIKSLKEDINLMEIDYMKQIDEEKKEKIKLKEKILKYEEIEDELAKIIKDKKNEINLDKLGDEKYFKNVGQKKYNQSLILINTIKIMKVEIEKLKIENEQLNNNLKIADDQCNIYKNISDKINQPYAYLVKNLQDKDLEALKLNQIISNKDQAINKLKQQCELYENQINTMKNEMASIINNRKQINNLENLLINYVNNENEGKNNDRDIDRISYFLNNFNNNVSVSFDKKFAQTNNNFNKNFNMTGKSQNNNFMTFPQNKYLTMTNFNKNNNK